MLHDVVAIWQAGVKAVDPVELVARFVRCSQSSLQFGKHILDNSSISEVCVVGAGKASAGMAKGLEQALANSCLSQRLSGHVIVPDTQVTQLASIQLVAGRSGHVNLPTRQAVEETTKILATVSRLNNSSLCIVLISGGGSALLTAPRPPVSLEDKIATIRALSDAGATIEQLNSIRGRLSLVKHGGLANACQASRMIGLILSDVIGDSFEAVASGPTFQAPEHQFQNPKLILESLSVDFSRLPLSVQTILLKPMDSLEANPIGLATAYGAGADQVMTEKSVHNFLLGNNQTAMAGCVERSAELGHLTEYASLDKSESVQAVAEKVVQIILNSRRPKSDRVYVFGGEPTIPLVTKSMRGLGGRNQQLVLEVWLRLKQVIGEDWDLDVDFALLCGGTDGEDGPTDAAGGWLTSQTFKHATLQTLARQCERNDAYPLLAEVGQLFQPGVTGTNVCDLIVLKIS